MMIIVMIIKNDDDTDDGDDDDDGGGGGDDDDDDTDDDDDGDDDDHGGCGGDDDDDGDGVDTSILFSRYPTNLQRQPQCRLRPSQTKLMGVVKGHLHLKQTPLSLDHYQSQWLSFPIKTENIPSQCKPNIDTWALS